MNFDLTNCLLSNFCKLIPICLDGSNYVNWKFLLETLLKGCGLLKYIDGSFPCPPEHMNMEENGVESKEHMNWVQTDAAIMSILAATLSNDAVTFIVGSKTSREIWCRLKEKYVDDSRYNIMNLTKSLYHIQKGSDSIDRYLLRVKSICDQLVIMGVYMDDEDIVVSVLNGLPSEFATIKAIIRIKALSSSVSMRELRSLLLIAEDEINQTVKSIFERFKTEMMTQGDSFRGSIPAPTPITSAKYDGGIPYNVAAFNNGTSQQNDFQSAASLPSHFLPSLISQENSCFAKKGDVVTQHGGSLLVPSAAFDSTPQVATISALPALGNLYTTTIDSRRCDISFLNNGKNMLSGDGGGIQNVVLDKSFPSLGTGERQGVHDVRKVPSMGFPLAVQSLAVDIDTREEQFKSALAEVSNAITESNSSRSFSVQPTVTSTSVSGASIVVTPSPKASALIVSDKLKPKTSDRAGEMATPVKGGQQQPSQSQAPLEQALGKKSEALLTIGPPTVNKSMMNCRKACQAMEFLSSLPLISPG